MTKAQTKGFRFESPDQFNHGMSDEEELKRIGHPTEGLGEVLLEHGSDDDESLLGLGIDPAFQ